jgi:hypothetical protein
MGRASKAAPADAVNSRVAFDGAPVFARMSPSHPPECP